MKKNRISIGIVFFAFFIFCLVSVISIRVQVSNLNRRYENVKEGIELAEERLSELEYECSLDKEAYIERLLRKNGYRKENELVFREEN